VAIVVFDLKQLLDLDPSFLLKNSFAFISLSLFSLFSKHRQAGEGDLS
jgi:hypothetical protein